MLLIILLISWIWQAYSAIDFSGHRIYHLTPTNLEELELLIELSLRNEFDMWTYPTSIFEPVNIRVPVLHIDGLEKQLKDLGLDFEVAIDDIQKFIDKERKENSDDDMEAALRGNISVEYYHSFDFISSYLDGLQKRYPSIARVQIFGRTHEKNPIKGIKLGVAGSNKKAIWIDSNVHAREWISSASSLYIIDQLIKGYKTNEEITRLLTNFDWYIIPVLNVDGYKYTWTENRMWRKNRVPTSKSEATGDLSCYGADPNRNFAVDFGGNGTSTRECSGIYTGESPFSEAESRAVRDGVLSLGDSLKAYFSLHSYSQLFMIPFGYTLELPPDYEEMMTAVEHAIVAIADTHGKYYKHGTIAKTIYSASGASSDWVYKEGGVTYSFAIELRDQGKTGFLLPNTEIIPTAEELFAGIKAIARILEKKYNLVVPEKSEVQKQTEVRNS